MLMINLNHPCREVDVWEAKTGDDILVALRQGYMFLDNVRRRMDGPTDEQLDDLIEKLLPTAFAGGIELYRDKYRQLIRDWACLRGEKRNE